MLSKRKQHLKREAVWKAQQCLKAEEPSTTRRRLKTEAEHRLNDTKLSLAQLCLKVAAQQRRNTAALSESKQSLMAELPLKTDSLLMAEMCLQREPLSMAEAEQSHDSMALSAVVRCFGCDGRISDVELFA
jgi:hypothetical protein